MSRMDWERIQREALSLISNGLVDKGDDAGRVFAEFAHDDQRPILHDATIRTWLPQRLVDDAWQSPIAWMPRGFRPFAFQARAFSRLSVSGQLPRPTAIAAPDGSGKSECFLLPMLDHCARQRGMGRPGIKAVIVYASRAAAADNAARLGTYCGMADRFKDLRPGLLVDDFGASDSVGPGFVVDSLDALTASPPDLLLTVPEMLNRSLLNMRHGRIWADTTPASLRFIVLDDLHVYTDKGIEDLAILLRRLGVKLHMASPSQPLAGAVPVVTAGVRMEALVSEDLQDAPQVSGPVAATPAPSGLPRPSADVREGPSALPDISQTPASGPDHGRPAGGFLAGGRPNSPVDSGLPGLQGGGSGLPGLSGGLPGLSDGEDDPDQEYEPHPLLDLATYLFGVRFTPESLVVDTPLDPDEVCAEVDDRLPMPALSDLAKIPPHRTAEVLQELFGPETAARLTSLPFDPVALGSLLCTHPLIHAIVTTTHQRPATADEIASAAGLSPVDALAGVERVAGLIGAARRRVGDRLIPVVRITGRVGLGAAPRIMRQVGGSIDFAHPDDVDPMDPALMSPPTTRPARKGPGRVPYLPAVACRHCGASGWLASLLGHNRHKVSMPSQIDEPLGAQSGNLALLMTAGPTVHRSDESARLLDPGSLLLHRLDEVSPADGELSESTLHNAVAVVMSSGSSAVSQRLCPSCGQPGGVDLLGATPTELLSSATRTLLSDGTLGQGRRVVVITTSSGTADEQLDSFAEDSYGDLIRQAVLDVFARVPNSAEAALPLDALASEIVAAATTPAQRRELVPADLQHDERLSSLDSDTPTGDALRVLVARVAFELSVEFGRRSPHAQSLTTCGRVSVMVRMGDWARTAAEIREKIRSETDLDIPESDVAAYLKGLVDRLRLNGAIRSSLLEPFVLEGGNPDFIGSRRPLGLAELHGSETPRFITTAVESAFDSVTAIHQRPGGARTWLVEWACSTLGINSVDAPAVNWASLEALAQNRSAVFALDSLDGHRVYGLTSDGIRIEVSDASAGAGMRAEPDDFRISAASTVDQSPFERAQTEWSFKYGASIDGPNVLYMSAGHVRSDRDALDTSVDLAAVDSVIVEAAAVDELGSVPELGRVGITSGLGTIVSVGTDTTATKALPPVPTRIRASEDDYLDFLFDRVADDRINFAAQFETIAEMMALADEVSVSDQPPPQPSDAGDDLVVQKFDFMPAQFVPERKGLIDTVVAGSSRDSKQVETFLRTVATGHQDAEAERIREFAATGVRDRLEALRDAWHAEVQTCRDAGVVPTAEVWHDALTRLSKQIVAPKLASGAEQSVRIELPVLDIQGLVRAEGFAAALRLGLVEHFGDPCDLQVQVSMEPVRGGSICRGVVRISSGDEPAAAGQLRALADPSELRSALVSTRALFSTDDAPTLPGIDLVLETLESTLDHLERRASGSEISDADDDRHAADDLKARELTRAFELALGVWVDRYPDVDGSLTVVTGSGGQPGAGGFELGMTFDGAERRYHIVRRSSGTSSVTGGATGGDTPEVTFGISPSTGDWPRIDLYLQPLDGDEAALNRTVVDLKRALDHSNESGALGWVLTWADVRDFYDAASASDAADAPDHQILSPQARRAATEVHGSSHDGGPVPDEALPSGSTARHIRVDSLEQNAFALLLDLLARPHREGWAAALASLQRGVDAAGPGSLQLTSAADNLFWASLQGLRSRG